MPSNHASSPTKRSVSSPQASSDLSAMFSQSPKSPNTSTAPQSNKPAAAHKPHRTRLVGANRGYGRNLSHKSLNKIQRLAIASNLAGETDPPLRSPLRHHQRKKSAPVSPSTSPRTGNHVRWNGSVVALSGLSTHTPMRKNLSTPTLKRDGSGPAFRKGKLLAKPDKVEKPEQKKSVGFELADSDEEDEWEDHSSQSPASTRRNSLVLGKANGESSNLHSSLTFTKSPLGKENNATDMKNQKEQKGIRLTQDPPPPAAPLPQDRPRAPDREDVTSRLLQRPHSSKAPPTISSISATATPAPVDQNPNKSSSFANLSNLGAPNQSQGPPSSSNKAGTNKVSPHTATSSSAEAGVSRFLINNSNGPGPSESDLSTPSSFLPHYRPTPPSPDATTSKIPNSPTRSRRRPAEPHSRTQQKLWLQRTATLSTSPSEQSMGGLAPTMSPSTADPNVVIPTHSRSSSGLYGHDGHRLAIAPSGLSGGPTTESEAKRAKKIYERFTTEFSVMHRFRNPVIDSLSRIHQVIKSQPLAEPMSRAHASSPGLLNRHEQASRKSHSRDPSMTRDAELNTQFLSRPSKHHSQVRFQSQEDMVHIVNANQPVARSDVESTLNRPTPVSVVLSDGNVYDENFDEPNENGQPAEGNSHAQRTSQKSYRPSEEDLLIRRMWESREVAVAGD